MSLTNLPNISIADNAEVEQMRLLVLNAIDDLEQMARARELTNIIWEVNANSHKTEQDWQKTEVLLESYEKARDESLESALSNLRQLEEIMNDSTLSNLSLQDFGANIGFYEQMKPLVEIISASQK